MHMRPTILLICAIAVAGCGMTAGRVAWRDELDRCEHEVSRSGAQGSQRIADLVDLCMEAKGWQATQACRETQMAGSSAFCDYRR
jgi:hypothetical protein